MSILRILSSALRRRLLGISADEIRGKLEDLRREIASVRSETGEEIAKLRREIDAMRDGEDRPKGPEIPVAEA
jgi:hypothetical protein